MLPHKPPPVAPTYIPLRNHSAYSLLEGAIPVNQLIQLAREYSFPALGLADTGNLFGAMEFSLAAQSVSIQPILGCQLKIHPPQARHAQVPPWSLVLFVQNVVGYRNLVQLVSRCTVGQQRDLHGRLTFDQLKGRTQGLIALSGGAQGPLNQQLALGNAKEAALWGQRLDELFPQRFYIELGRYDLPGERDREEILINLAYTHNWPLVATQEAFFPYPEYYAAHDALLCVAQGSYVNETKRHRVTPQHFFKTAGQMEDLFSDLPEALTNTVLIAQRCHFLLEPVPPQLPVYIDHTYDGGEESLLRSQAQEGLGVRLSHLSTPSQQSVSLYHERLTYELDMIIKMGFAGYFLIVADFIQWAKSQNIPVGPGRGSGASSLVAWALSITDVDPIRFGLFFERFLNPERVSMADFDIDFCQRRRDEVIAYVQNRYGADHVAHIITFGKLQARAVLRDVGRVLQMPYPQVDRICRLIPHNPAHPISLSEALAQDPQLQKMQQEDEQVQELMKLSLKLEGLYRHASTHAAGVVIGKDPLETSVALYQDLNSALPATQFNMKYIEMAGLVKFDFLGLKTLTMIQSTVDFLKDKNIAINISHIPLDDLPTFSLLNRVETVGVFQLEGDGMSDVLRILRPERIEEIIALVALYRPGPMDDIPRYLACRNGDEKIEYPYPCVNKILEETFGVIVYQEQVLQIARELAGYTLGGADLLRRAMGKKIPQEMAAQRKVFVEGVLKHNPIQPFSDQEAQGAFAAQLFDQIAKFAGYGFNKGHAAPYALLSYQTAYLKANFPVAFFVACCNQDYHITDRLAVFVQDARRMDIKVLPPDINSSGVLAQGEVLPTGQDGLRYGLAALKNVGLSAMEDVVACRNQGGAFISVFDFFERMPTHALNKRQMESLIAAGAFDTLHPNRNQLFCSLEKLMRHGASTHHQDQLFEVHETRPNLIDIEDWPFLEKLRHELGAVGFYLNHHPLESYGQDLKQLSWVDSCAVRELLQANPARSFSMIGTLTGIQQKRGKSGKKHAFLQMSDTTGVFEVLIFSELLEDLRVVLIPGNSFILWVDGRAVGESIRLSCQTMMSLDDLAAQTIQECGAEVETVEQLHTLKRTLEGAAQGSTKMKVYLNIQTPHGSCRVTLVVRKNLKITRPLREDLEKELNLQWGSDQENSATIWDRKKSQTFQKKEV